MVNTTRTIRCNLPTVWDSFSISLASIEIHCVASDRAIDGFKVRLAQLIRESFPADMVRVDIQRSSLTEKEK